MHLQVISALAADANEPSHAFDAKPQVASVFLKKSVEFNIPAYLTTKIVVSVHYPLRRWWDVYSPSEFKGGIGIEAMDFATGDLYSGAVAMAFSGEMNGGMKKPGVGARVALLDQDMPSFRFRS